MSGDDGATRGPSAAPAASSPRAPRGDDGPAQTFAGGGGYFAMTAAAVGLAGTTGCARRLLGARGTEGPMGPPRLLALEGPAGAEAVMATLAVGRSGGAGWPRSADRHDRPRAALRSERPAGRLPLEPGAGGALQRGALRSAARGHRARGRGLAVRLDRQRRARRGVSTCSADACSARRASSAAASGPRRRRSRPRSSIPSRPES